jgi:hypothetical protein
MLAKIAETIAHSSSVLPARRTKTMALLGPGDFGMTGCTERRDASLRRALWQPFPA